MNDTNAQKDQLLVKTPAKERYHHGDLRSTLVERTRQLIEEKGPDHISVSEVARAAGVSTAAPYRHFRDKDQILAEVCVSGMRRHYDEMLEALSTVPEGSLERISALGRVYVEFALREPGVFRLSFGAKQTPEAIEDLKDFDTFGVVAGEVASLLGLPKDHPEAVRRAFVLWTFVHGLSFLLIDDKVRYAGIDDGIDVDALLADIGQRVMRDPA